MTTFTHRTATIVISTVTLILIVIIGIWSTLYIGTAIRTEETQSLLLRAGTIARMINQRDLGDLSGTTNDLKKESYQNIKGVIEDVHALNTDSRFVYIMGVREATQFFYVDSEDPSSKDYSPPGEVYTDATTTDVYNHIHGIPYISGPYTDGWGTWISAYAPIVDSDTGRILALVGIDVEAKHILSKIMIARIGTIALFSLLGFSLLLLVILIQKSARYEETLEKENQDLALDKEYLLEAEHIARLGKLTWSATTNEVLINQIVMDLIWSKQSKVPLSLLREYVNSDDITRITEELKNTDDRDTSFVTFKYRITTPNQKEHNMVSLCKILRDAKGKILRVVCTAQDMSD